MPPKQKLNSSRTHYYDLLGVQSSATEKELKTAYRKKALQLHPDKQGGDGEPFKNMKYAYDVLNDPKKRQMYDRYGEAGVRLVEGTITPDVAQQMFLSIGPCERLFLISILTLILGYLLLFPILLSIRWDHPNSMDFAHVFLPTWLGLGLVLIICLCASAPPFPAPEEEDEHLRNEIEEKQQETLKQFYLVKFGTIGFVLGLALLLFLIVLRLDGETNWSYFLVIWPWILLEVGQLVVRAVSSASARLPADTSTTDKLCFYVTAVAGPICKIILACLIAYKLDGHRMTWWEVFIPLWVEYIVITICHMLAWDVIVAAAVEPDAPEDRKSQISSSLSAAEVFRVMWLGFLVLLCWKLEHPSSFPAWVLFLPVFVLTGCLCCCISCGLCCMSPEALNEDDEETGIPGAKDRPTYGTMR